MISTGLIQSPARQIVERLKSVMQIRESSGGKKAYSGIGACALDLIKREGFRNGLFQGFSSVLMREIPQFAVYYPSYELFKKAYSEVSTIFVNSIISVFASVTTSLSVWGFVHFFTREYSCIHVTVCCLLSFVPSGFYQRHGFSISCWRLCWSGSVATTNI